MRTLFILAPMAFLGACDLSDPDPLAACQRAADGGTCPECYDGDVTCELDGISVTEASCGECQARYALDVALCDAGSTASHEEIEAVVCDNALTVE